MKEFNPNEPFVAQDGFEYEDFAAFLCGEPQDSFRNRWFRCLKAVGQEDIAQAWIAAWDKEASKHVWWPGAHPDPEIVERCATAAHRAVGVPF